MDQNGVEHVVHDGFDISSQCPVNFVITFPLTSYKVVAVNITSERMGWEGIDSVKLVGLEHGLKTAEKVFLPKGSLKPEGIVKSQGNSCTQFLMMQRMCCK
jgi:hypothetical protein